MLSHEPDLIPYLQLVLSAEDAPSLCKREGDRIESACDRIDPDVKTKLTYKLFCRSHLLKMLGDCLLEDTEIIEKSKELDIDYVPILSRLRIIFSNKDSVEPILRTVEDKVFRNEPQQARVDVLPQEPIPEPLRLVDVPDDLSFDTIINLPPEMQMLIRDKFVIQTSAEQASNETMKRRFDGLDFVYYQILLLFLIEKIWGFIGNRGTYRLQPLPGHVLHVIDLRYERKENRP